MRRYIAPILILAICGCKGGRGQYLKNPGPAKLAAGWKLAKSEADGVSVGVPPGWREGTGGLMPDLSAMIGGSDTPSGSGTPPPMDPKMQEMMAGFESAAKEREAEAMAEFRKKGVLLHMVQTGFSVPGEQRTRFVVKRTRHSGTITLEEAASAEAEFLQGEGKPKKVGLPVGPAMLFKAEMKNRIGDIDHRISYVMVHGNDAYALRFVATNNASTIASIAPSVAETFRVK